MLTSLLVPVVLSAVALFFASFLSWMVLPIHFKDWKKFAREDELMDTVRTINLPPGSYMFPGWETPAEMKGEEYQRKSEAGPKGVITVFGKMNMGRELGLTFLYFLVVCFVIAYLATIGLKPGAAPKEVFRFVSTAALLAFLASIVQHAIWFQVRIVGHVIESIAYALITGAIFASMWPGGSA